MSNDELISEIREKFRSYMDESEGVQDYLERILERAKAGKATQTEIDNFIDALGYRLSETIQEVLGASDLQLTAEDYEEILSSVLHDNYDLVNKICAESQKRIDMQNNLTIRPQKADFPTERVKKIASAAAESGISDEKKQRRLDSPIRNITRSFQDDFAKENAEFRTNAGIKCKIIRTTDGHCCDWCSALAGTYDYATAPEMVFHRHDNCGCSVVFENGRIHQDVWSKKYLSDDDAEERKQYGMRGPSRFTNQEALALQEKNLAELDKEVSESIQLAKEQQVQQQSSSEESRLKSLSENSAAVLKSSYEENRTHFQLNLVPAEEMQQQWVNYKGLTEEAAKSTDSALKRLQLQYYSTLSKVQVRREGLTGIAAYATPARNAASSTIALNADVMNDNQKLLQIVKYNTTPKKGRLVAKAVEIQEGKEAEYFITHEYGHSIYTERPKKELIAIYGESKGEELFRMQKHLKTLYSDYRKEMSSLQKELDEVEKALGGDVTDEEFADLLIRMRTATGRVQTIKISEYAGENADEFIAEVFTQSQIGKQQSPYTVSAMELLDEHFKKPLTHRDYEDIIDMKGKMSNYEVREWYIAHDKSILSQIDKSKPLRDQAVQAHALRNQYKFQARELMENQEERQLLDKEHPLHDFSYYFEKYSKLYGSEEEVYEAILSSSTRSNKTVNKKFGLE